MSHQVHAFLSPEGRTNRWAVRWMPNHGFVAVSEFVVQSEAEAIARASEIVASNLGEVVSVVPGPNHSFKLEVKQ